jgi:AcrR family transcriptional regulator
MADSAARSTARPSRPRPHRRGAGRPLAAESAQRAEDLLEVAAQVFFERGYERATVGEIARRAHASKQTLYSRFPTKADLFTAVMKRRSDAGFARVTTLVQSAEPIDRVLGDYAIELFLPFVNQDLLRLLRTIINASEMFPDVGRAFWTIGPVRAHEMLADLVRDRMAKGELRQDDPSEAAHLFLAMCSGRYWYRTLVDIRPRVTKAEVDTYARRVVESFLRIYATTPLRT